MCAKDTSQTERRYQSAATCLDFFEAVHRRRVDPLMYCHLTLEAPLECARLKHAVAQTRSVVPEVFCVYDFQKNAFVDEGFTAEAMVFSGAPPVRWRLDRRPQLQIYMNGRSLSIGMSHLLADGRGFLQYLYLLAFFYRMPHAMLSLPPGCSGRPCRRAVGAIGGCRRCGCDQQEKRLYVSASGSLCRNFNVCMIKPGVRMSLSTMRCLPPMRR